MPNLTRNQKLARTAMLAAITLILALTPLGYIPLNPLVTLTIMVSPVVLGGMLYGWKSGLVLGLVFGLSSFYKAPTEVLGQVMLAQSGLLAFLACVLPRAAVGLFGGLMNPLLKKEKYRYMFVYALMGIGGSLLNTVLFLGFIYLVFDSALTGVTLTALLGVLSYNGLIEAIANGVIVAAIAQVVVTTNKRRKNKPEGGKR